MQRRNKEKFKRQRKPIIFIVCEGRNKTERIYFSHFNERHAPYNLRIVNCESTDITSMAKRAHSIFVENDLDLKNGDLVYCLVDLDLEQHKYDKFIKAKEKYKKIKIIPSNPCFEVWLQYYFTGDPKVVNSSIKAKENMAKLVPGYTESMDIISKKQLDLKEHLEAIEKSNSKNARYAKHIETIEKNPYTEIGYVVEELIRYKTNKNL